MAAAKKVATKKPAKKSVVAKKATIKKPQAARATAAKVTTVSRDYTAPLTAVWVGLIIVFLLIVLYKMY